MSWQQKDFEHRLKASTLNSYCVFNNFKLRNKLGNNFQKMIMAGRGRRLCDTEDGTTKVGIPQGSKENTPVDVSTLKTKISDIDCSAIDPTLLNCIESMFTQLLVSKEVAKEVISELHSKSLDDEDFGEKFIVAIERVLHLEIDGTIVRSELLSLIQNDFIKKKETFYSDPRKFLISVMLLGYVYNRIKVSGRPIAILAPALFEYFDLLLKGGEEHLKVLIKQLIINGRKLSEVDNYKQFMQNLRNALITGNLNATTKCWILLGIDFTSNGFQPLKDGVKDFYETNLGVEYMKLEKLIEQNNQIVCSQVSPASCKSQGSSGSPKNKKFNSSPRRSDNVRKDLSKKFSDMSMKSPGDGKVHSPPGKSPKSDNWKPNEGGRRSSGHDDRFEKDENFYGVQKPRQPRPDNQRKKFDDKSSKKEFDHFKAGVDDKVESENTPASDGKWN